MSDSLIRRKKSTPELSIATPPFLAALYDILNQEDPSVIGWCDDGRAFGVYNIQVLETRILPAYYRLSKFASFQRQLNYFGFRKIITSRSSSEPGTFYAQPLFLRDDPARMLQIKRKTYRAKGYNSRRSAAAAAQAKYLQPAEYFNEPSHTVEATEEESKPRRESVAETKTTTPSQRMDDKRWPEFKMDDDDANLGPYLDFMLERDQQAFEADSKEEYFMSPIPFNQGGSGGDGLLDEDILLLTSLISPSNSDGSSGSNN